MNTPLNPPTQGSKTGGGSRERRGRGGAPTRVASVGDRRQPEDQPVTDNESHSTALLHTPADAARLLAVPESWLRRKAGRRLIPCTFVGKHLRFTAANLAEITDTGSQTVRLPRRGSRAA